MLSPLTTTLSWELNLQEIIKDVDPPMPLSLRVDLVKSSETKESKGFGFIKFALEDHARMAVDGLEGKMVLGKRVRAQIARRKGGESWRGGYDDDFPVVVVVVVLDEFTVWLVGMNSCARWKLFGS